MRIRPLARFYSHSLCIPPLCEGVPVTGGVNYGKSSIDHNYQSATGQSGIAAGDKAGAGGFDIQVAGNTDLQGGAITSTASAGHKLPDSSVDMAHTIGADYNARTGKVTGGHSTLNGDVKVTDIVNPPDANGVYVAKVQMQTPDGTWISKVIYLKAASTLIGAAAGALVGGSAGAAAEGGGMWGWCSRMPKADWIAPS
jgi:hypothetical protein